MSRPDEFSSDPASGLPPLPEDVQQFSGNLEGSGRRVVIAAARFNISLTGALVSSAVETLLQHGVRANDIAVAWVPGSLEIPQVLQRLYREQAPDAMIACGVVIEGATRHAELITHSVSQSLARLSLELDVPVIDAVVHAHTLKDAEERCLSGENSRGAYAALAALETSSVVPSSDR